jgi:4,5-DOPA dioxygenase extradiol
MDVSARMPVLFVGHGSPMNAIEDSPFSRGWQAAAEGLPQPLAILCISAHWETEGAWVTAMPKPRTIHDFGGFPQTLYDVQYPAPGSAWLVKQVTDILGHPRVRPDMEWGLDHGCWAVLRRMYPNANVPVVQLSLDIGQTAQAHYQLAKELAPLRDAGVLIVGSGNMVHNLRRIEVRGEDLNEPYGLPWALEASETLKRLIAEHKHAELVDYQELGRAVQLAVPTREHYLPMLYALALQGPDEPLRLFNDVAVAGSLTMTSFVIGEPPAPHAAQP